MFIVRSGNLGYVADDSVECGSLAQAREVIRDEVSDYRYDGFRLESHASARRIKRLNPGESVQVALLVSPLAAITIRVERAL